MQEFIISLMNQYGYLGIFAFIALENIFPPIPSEVILTFGGFLTLSTEMNFWGVVIAATLGAVVGAIVLYFVGRLLDFHRLEKLIDSKVGKILHLKKGDFVKADQWFDQKGKWTVFFCRMVPIVRSLISVPAGMSKMPMPQFLLLTTLGTLIWNIVLVYLGVIAGESWPTVVSMFEEGTHIVVIILAVLVLIAAGIFWYRRSKKKKNA